MVFKGKKMENSRISVMKSFKVAILLCSILALNSWAIFGIGGHWSPSTAKLTGSSGSIYSTGTDPATIDLSIEQKGIDDFYGFGFKAWVDLIKYLNFEVNMNLNFNEYSSTIILEGPNDTKTEIPIEFAFDEPMIPSDTAKPAFASIITDLTVYVPFINIGDKIIKYSIYAGAGLSYFYTTASLNQKFAEEFFKGEGKEAAEEFINQMGEDLISDPNSPPNTDGLNQFATAVGAALAKDGINRGVGGHLMAGSRLKLPFVAIYANGKYYFGGGTDKQYNTGIVFELGGGVAF